VLRLKFTGKEFNLASQISLLNTSFDEIKLYFLKNIQKDGIHNSAFHFMRFVPRIFRLV